MFCKSELYLTQCGKVCDKCIEKEKKKYHKDIFDDSNYYADEPIEPEDY